MKCDRYSDDTRYFTPPTKIQPSRNEECMVCAENILIFAHFVCNHYCCYLCALRMRKIGEFSCLVCRRPSVTLHLSTLPYVNDSIEMKFHKKSGLFYDSDEIMNHINDLEILCCPRFQCRGNLSSTFESFHLLKKHLFEKHRLTYCDICIESKPCFLIEQNLFDQDSLNLHMKGEFPSDSVAFLGHIYCHFCKKYMYDVEVFVRHMKELHIVCDLCAQIWPNRYFADRKKLYKHFQSEHFICEHPNCSKEDILLKTFSSEIELISHSINVHRTKSGKRILVNPNNMGFRFIPASQGISAIFQDISIDDIRQFMITFDFLNFQRKVNIQKYTHSSAIVSTATDHEQNNDEVELKPKSSSPMKSKGTNNQKGHLQLPNLENATRYKKVVMNGDKHRNFMSNKIPQRTKIVSSKMVLLSNEKLTLSHAKSDSTENQNNNVSEPVSRSCGSNCENLKAFPNLHDSYNTPQLKYCGRVTGTQAFRSRNLQKSKPSVWESKEFPSFKGQK